MSHSSKLELKLVLRLYLQFVVCWLRISDPSKLKEFHSLRWSKVTAFWNVCGCDITCCFCYSDMMLLGWSSSNRESYRAMNPSPDASPLNLCLSINVLVSSIYFPHYLNMVSHVCFEVSWSKKSKLSVLLIYLFRITGSSRGIVRSYDFR